MMRLAQRYAAESRLMRLRTHRGRIETLIEAHLAEAEAIAAGAVMPFAPNEIEAHLDAVERLITVLDLLDGDPDQDCCAAGDDDLDPVSNGVLRASLGEDDPGVVPEYGWDQSEGPLNSVGQPRAGWADHSWGGA